MLLKNKIWKAFFSSTFFSILCSFLQLATFVIIARCLGAEQSSILFLIQVFVSFLAEALGPGANDFAVKNLVIKKNEAFIINDVVLSYIYSIPFVSIFFFVCFSFYTKPTLLILLFFIFEILQTRLISFVDVFYSVTKEFLKANIIKTSIYLTKLILCCYVFLLLEQSDIHFWMLASFILSTVVVISLFSIFYFKMQFTFSINFFCYRFKENFYPGLFQFLRACLQNADKVVFGYVFSPTLFSSYSIAYRFSQYSLIPIVVFQRINYPKYFSEANISVRACFNFALKNLKPTLFISFASFLSMLVASFLSTYIFGTTYNHLSIIILILSILPIVISVSNVFFDFMVSCGFSKLRVYIQFFSLILLLALLYLFASEINFLLSIYIVLAVYFLQMVCAIFVSLTLLVNNEV